MASAILGSIRQDFNKVKEVIPPLYSALVRQCLSYWVELWLLSSRAEDILEEVQSSNEPQRWLKGLEWEKAERVGSVHLRGGSGESGQCVLMTEGRMQSRQSQALSSGSHWQDNRHKLKQGRFIRTLRNTSTVRVTEHWNRSSREVVEFLSLEVL